MYLSKDLICQGCQQDLIRDCQLTLNASIEHPCAVVASRLMRITPSNLEQSLRDVGSIPDDRKSRIRAWQQI